MARTGLYVRGVHPLAPVLEAVGDLKCFADVMARHAGSANPQLNACSALIALTSVSQAAAKSAADAGCLDSILKAAWRFPHDKSLQVSALRAAVGIACVDVQSATTAMEGRLYDVALVALEQASFMRDPDAVEAACNAICRGAASAITIIEKFFGGLDPNAAGTPHAVVMRVIREGPSGHRRLESVSRLVKAYEKAEERAMQAGASTKLRSAMVAHRGNRDVVKAARRALALLNESSDNVDATEQPLCAPALGACVVVCGLTGPRAADLNGAVGTVLKRADGADGRVTVQLNTEEEPIALRLERLLVAAAPPAQGGAPSPQKEERRQRRREAKALGDLFAAVCEATRAVAAHAEADGLVTGFATAAAEVAAAAMGATAAAGQRGGAQGRSSAVCAKCGCMGGGGAAAAKEGAESSAPPKAKKLQLCSRCEGVRYCSVECQKAHWKEHRGVCVAVKRTKAEEVE